MCVKAVVGGIVHESSTFAAEVTGLLDFGSFSVVDGAALVREFARTSTCVGGYLAVCAEADVTVAPALHARAEPAGTVDPAAYQELEHRLLSGVRAARDRELVLLDLHGAGVVAPGESLDRRVLAAVRAEVGPATTIAVTMDLHANLPAEAVELADVVVGYQCYPHTDIGERAERAGRIAIAARRGTVAPTVRGLRLPMVLPPSTTDDGPGRELRELARAAEERDGVLACTVFHGFPYADTAQAGASVVTITDGGPGLADEVNRDIARWLWRNRPAFLTPALAPDHAVAEALSGTERPAVLADTADNPGGGATGDGTYLLRAVLDSGARACFATLHDPATVALAVQAGVGATIEVALGGRHGPFSGDPVRAHATVRALTDGNVVHQSMRRGKAATFGPSARLLVGNADVIVSTHRLQVFDPEILLLHGVVPGRYELVAVKSAHHFRSGFAAVSTRMIAADALGLTSRQVERIRRTGPSAELWPMNREARFALDEPVGAPTHRRNGAPQWT
jgi:microcystin degradation protein MlrC